MEFVITINLYYIALLALGFGLGYLCLAGVGQQRETRLDQKKHDIEVKKEWYRMLAEQNNKKKSSGYGYRRTN
jgi:hypothetical protein